MEIRIYEDAGLCVYDPNNILLCISMKYGESRLIIIGEEKVSLEPGSGDRTIAPDPSMPGASSTAAVTSHVWPTGSRTGDWVMKDPTRATVAETANDRKRQQEYGCSNQ